MNLDSNLVYIEPHHLIEGATSKVFVTARHAIAYRKEVEPRYEEDGVSDEDILWDFIALNNAWIVPETETYDWEE